MIATVASIIFAAIMAAALCTVAFMFACGPPATAPTPPGFAPAIERGLNAAFTKARCRGYTKSLNVSDYRITTENGEMSDAGIPAIRMPCGPYCGTEYDKGGYILAAGQFIEPNTIRVPEQSDPSLIVEYEAEHKILRDNDRREYERTKIHTGGSGHPIIPNCGE